MMYVIIVVFLLLATACKGQVCGFDLVYADNSPGCCVNLSTCNGGAGECVQASANFLSKTGGAYPAVDAVCYQSDCLNVFPASCAVIDRTLSPREDDGRQLCSDAFPARGITPEQLPSPGPPTPADPPGPDPPGPPTTPESSAITPAPTGNDDGGTSCIAQDQTVFEENRGKINVSNLKIGNKVMTHQGFHDFIGYIHKGSFQYTLIITIDTGNIVELTEDHLVKVENNYVHAKYVKIGDQLSSGKVLKIINGRSFVVSPLTRSGTIIVNDVVLSCYANVFSHNIANFVLAPLRVNLMKNVNKYFSALIAVYNVSPKWFRHMIAANDSYTF